MHTINIVPVVQQQHELITATKLRNIHIDSFLS